MAEINVRALMRKEGFKIEESKRNLELEEEVKELRRNLNEMEERYVKQNKEIIKVCDVKDDIKEKLFCRELFVKTLLKRLEESENECQAWKRRYEETELLQFCFRADLESLKGLRTENNGKQLSATR